MASHLRLVIPPPDNALVPESTRGGLCKCPACGIFSCNYMSGFIRNVFLLKLHCTACHLGAVYTEMSPPTAPNDKMIVRAQHESSGFRAISSQATRNMLSKAPQISSIRIHNGTREGLPNELAKGLPDPDSDPQAA